MESFEAKAKVPTCDTIKPKVSVAPSNKILLSLRVYKFCLYIF